MPNVLTINVENWSFNQTSVFPNLIRILSLLKKKKTKATFFVSGSLAERNPDVVRLILQEWQEIGSLGYEGKVVYKQTPLEFEQEILKSLKTLEKISGEKIKTYRAPYFSINEDCLWAFDILAELGIEYDSSISPAQPNSIAGVPQKIFPIYTKSEKIIWEFPLAMVKILGKKFALAEGDYLGFYPFWFSHWSLGKLNSNGKLGTVYLQPNCNNGHSEKFDLKFLESFWRKPSFELTLLKLEKLLSDFKFTSMEEAYKKWTCSKT